MNPLPILLLLAAFMVSAFAIGGIGRRDPAVNALGWISCAVSLALVVAAAFMLWRAGP